MGEWSELGSEDLGSNPCSEIFLGYESFHPKSQRSQWNNINVAVHQWRQQCFSVTVLMRSPNKLIHFKFGID